MVFAQDLLAKVERALEERFGLRVLPLRGVEFRKVAEAYSGGRMVFAERLLPDVEGALVERFGLRVLPLRGVEFRQVVEALAMSG